MHVYELPSAAFSRIDTTDATGQFSLPNVPFNSYRLTYPRTALRRSTADVEIDSVVGTTVKLVLQVAGGQLRRSPSRPSGDLIENDPTFHTDVDRDMFIKVPLESQSSTLSSLVTLTTPGVSADSNGLFHGLGDHASNSFSVDGQSITDQQSKVFSNQLPSNSIQSIEVISGAPPAEYGGKTSLVIVATTRSGQGITKPTGSISSSYGTFGSAIGRLRSIVWRQQVGEFYRSGRAQYRPLSRSAGVCRLSRQGQRSRISSIAWITSITPSDSMHLDLNYSRSWFQNPNSYDNLNVQNVVSGGASANPVFANIGNTDQRSKIGTFNISPTYTRVISNNAVLNFGALCPQRPLQLLSQWQPAGRPGT